MLQIIIQAVQGIQGSGIQGVQGTNGTNGNNFVLGGTNGQILYNNSGSTGGFGNYAADKVSFGVVSNQGAGALSTLNLSGDLTTSRSSDSGVIYFGTTGGTYLYYNGTSYSLRSSTTSRNWTFTDSTGNFSSPGNVTAYSDARLKTNVHTITDALHKVTQLRGVTYHKDGNPGLGVIAQEVREILPELVAEGEDANKTLSVAYGNMVGVLIEAIKELKAEVDELKKSVGRA
jgi:hypothetical protein